MLHRYTAESPLTELTGWPEGESFKIVYFVVYFCTVNSRRRELTFGSLTMTPTPPPAAHCLVVDATQPPDEYSNVV